MNDVNDANASTFFVEHRLSRLPEPGETLEAFTASRSQRR